MNERQKAVSIMKSWFEKRLASVTEARDKRVVKLMNAADSQGNLYASQRDAQDAYGWDGISEKEYDRILAALDYMENRPQIREDYMISILNRCLNIVVELEAEEHRQTAAHEFHNRIHEIKRIGNEAVICVSCGKTVVGQNVPLFGIEYFSNGYESGNGPICKSCGGKRA